MDSILQITAGPQEFFREELKGALRDQKLEIDENIEFYVVNLLSNFISSSPDLFEKPLAFKLKDALEAPSEVRPKLFKQMADSSLYVAGFFQDAFNRKTYDIDYFISLGSTAYTSLSSEVKHRPKADPHPPEVFDEMSELFSDLVETLYRLSRKMQITPSTNLLATYERFSVQKSSYLLELLEAEGITPISDTLKIAQ